MTRHDIRDRIERDATIWADVTRAVGHMFGRYCAAAQELRVMLAQCDDTILVTVSRDGRRGVLTEIISIHLPQYPVGSGIIDDMLGKAYQHLMDEP